MSRILICGVAPLPVENTLQNYGPGMRSWQFAQGLALRGHTVRLLAMKIEDAYGDLEAVPRERIGDVDVERMSQRRFFDRVEIERRIEEFRPDALVGATIYGSSALAVARTDLPFWADQFGHVMAEAQARAALDGDDGVLGYFWNMVRPVDLRADRVSTVSERQRFAAIGELGALGRLTAATCGYELISCLPCAVVSEPAAEAANPVFRGTKVPGDAFVVLWGGSYNVWSDVDTLFTGLERAMADDPRIHFVSTGGSVRGHDDLTYPSLREAIAASELRDRFHLEGWVASELVPSYVAEADLGILSEKSIYEGELGSKNRIIQWMASGLPVVSNRFGDLGDHLADHRLGLTYSTGDAESLAEQVVWAAGHRAELREMARRARRFVLDEFSIEKSTEPLALWAEAPERAPGPHMAGRGPRSSPTGGQAPAPPPPEPALLAKARTLATKHPALRRLAPLVRAGRRLAKVLSRRR